MKSKKMMTQMVVLVSVALILTFNTVSASDDEQYEEKFEKTVVLAKDGKVFLRNVSGDIKVTTWDRAEVKIDALKISKASSPSKAEENAQKVKIEISEEGNTLRIETDYPMMTVFKSMKVSVRYDLTVPSQASVDIGSVSGDISMLKIGGTAKVQAVSGDLSFEDISGSIKANSVSGNVEVVGADKGAGCESVSGDVEVQNVNGDVYLKTVSGEISAAQVKGSVEAETVSGDVELDGVTEGRKIEAKSLSGEVRYWGDIYSDGRYNFKSHSGDITLVIPADSSFDIDAKTFSGDIDSQFDITVSGKISKKSVRGSVNDGGADVEVKTFSGDIRLNRK